MMSIMITVSMAQEDAEALSGEPSQPPPNDVQILALISVGGIDYPQMVPSGNLT